MCFVYLQFDLKFTTSTLVDLLPRGDHDMLEHSDYSTCKCQDGISQIVICAHSNLLIACLAN